MADKREHELLAEYNRAVQEHADADPAVLVEGIDPRLGVLSQKEYCRLRLRFVAIQYAARVRMVDRQRVRGQN